MRYYIFTIIFLSAFVLNAIAQEQKSFKEFFSNGKLKAIRHEGNFNGCNMPVGTDTLFFESGKIQSTIFYDNRKSNTEPGCHQGWTIETRRTFYENGHLKTKEQLKYSYEGTPCDCGTWISIQQNGKISKKKNYGNCYDQKPCKD